MLQVFFILICGSFSFADIYSFPDRELHVSSTIGNQNHELALRDNQSDKNLYYLPNMGSILTPKISYGDLWALSWGFNTPVAENEVLNKGITKFTDIRFDFAFQKFTINTYYSQYHGMYLDNSGEVDPQFVGAAEKIQRSDLYSRGYGVSFTWVWNNKNFSIPSLLTQSERQEKVGGSFLLGASITESIIRADSSLVPGAVQNNFDVLSSFTGGKFQTLSTKFGYGYSYSHKWFVGGGVLIGPGISRRNLRYDNRSDSKGWEPSLRAEVFLSCGYNGDVFFTSIKATSMNDNFYLTGSSSQVTLGSLSSGFTLGVHLDTLNF